MPESAVLIAERDSHWLDWANTCKTPEHALIERAAIVGKLLSDPAIRLSQCTGACTAGKHCVGALACLLLTLGGCSSSHGTRPVDDGGGSDAAQDAGAIDAGEPRSCAQPSECVIVSVGCCTVCGTPTSSDVTAIRRDALPARRERCKDVGCPACAESPNPSLIATCDAGRCEVVDLQQVPAVSACLEDDDCRVRATACCECGADTSPYALIAIAVEGEAALTSFVCDRPSQACPECAPIYPDAVSASCDPATRRCVATVH